jgi:hypothetical protein
MATLLPSCPAGIDPAVGVVAASVERRQPQRRRGVRQQQRRSAAHHGPALRHLVGIQRTLAGVADALQPLLYLPEGKARGSERMPPEGTAWCEGYMAGIKLRDDEWQSRLFDAPDARDWVFRSRRWRSANATTNSPSGWTPRKSAPN